MKKIFYRDFYGNRYALVETPDGAFWIGGGYMWQTEKRFKTFNGAKISLARFVGGLDYLTVTDKSGF